MIAYGSHAGDTAAWLFICWAVCAVIAIVVKVFEHGRKSAKRVGSMGFKEWALSALVWALIGALLWFFFRP